MAPLTNTSSEAMLPKAASANLKMTAYFLTDHHQGLIMRWWEMWMKAFMVGHMCVS